MQASGLGNAELSCAIAKSFFAFSQPTFEFAEPSDAGKAVVTVVKVKGGRPAQGFLLFPGHMGCSFGGESAGKRERFSGDAEGFRDGQARRCGAHIFKTRSPSPILNQPISASKHWMAVILPLQV